MIQRKFDLGNSTDGPFGMVIRSNGETVEDALTNLSPLVRELVNTVRPEVQFDGDDMSLTFTHRTTGEYLAVYISLLNIKPSDEEADEAEELGADGRFTPVEAVV